MKSQHYRKIYQTYDRQRFFGKAYEKPIYKMMKPIKDQFRELVGIPSEDSFKNT